MSALRWWLAMILLMGCRTVPELAPFDTSQTGWIVRQGQAVWKPNASAPELAGELVWATHPEGHFLLQFLKTPLTLIEAQGTKGFWQISFPPQGRTVRGSGQPAGRLGWMHLSFALQGRQLAEGWTFTRSGERWKIANARTGEVIEGYLRP